MSRATVYGLALLAATIAAVFSWKTMAAAGVAGGAWRHLVARTRTDKRPAPIRFGWITTTSLAYAAWNTRKLGHEREPLRCRLGLHSWESKTGIEWGGLEAPMIVTYQACRCPSCDQHGWSAVDAKPARCLCPNSQEINRGCPIHGFDPR